MTVAGTIVIGGTAPARTNTGPVSSKHFRGHY
jgi:hypothetical protein